LIVLSRGHRAMSLLQEEKFLKYGDGLRTMLARYHKVLSCLDDSEVNCCILSNYHSQLFSPR